jgi:hypothetical protein
VTEQRAHRLTVQLRCRVDDEPTPAGARSSDGHSVEGEVTCEDCEDGSIRAFTGWLGLVNELERVVAGSPSAGPATA